MQIGSAAEIVYDEYVVVTSGRHHQVKRLLLGLVFGVLTGALDVQTTHREGLPLRKAWILFAARCVIGLVIGSTLYCQILRIYRWMRGLVISLVLSIPVAVLLPASWQYVVGFGIAYGVIMGYLVDRLLPSSLGSEAEK